MTKTNLNTDNKAQSQKTGTAQTEEGTTVSTDTGGPVAKKEDETPEKAKILSREEQENLVGELEPGEEGWVPLNEVGEIIGPAKKGKAPADQLSARVVAPIDDRTPALTTPSGAPLTHRMNPDTTSPGDPAAEHPEHTGRD